MTYYPTLKQLVLRRLLEPKLSISGERRAPEPSSSPQGSTTVHLNERFAGSFRRTVSLPEDADREDITADYRDGVLHISVKRREAAQPRRITVQ